MKIYQLIVKLDEGDFVIGTFKNEDDALNGLADWTENSNAFNEAYESADSKDAADAIMEVIPEIYFPNDFIAHVIEYEVLDKYDKSLVKL